MHGGQAQITPGGQPFDYTGAMPFNGGPQCGTAFGQTIKIEGCTALVQAHGFSHSDNPHVNYLGTMTIDVRYMRKPDNSAADQIEINVYTPKQPIKLSGKVAGGKVVMPSCTAPRVE